MKVLLNIIPDRLSDLVRKGEITERYYNPGGLFDEVHLLLINDDRPDPASIQMMVGKARLTLHNLPVPSFLRTLGWQPLLMRDWVQAGLNLGRVIQPTLIRAYGNFHNGYLAAQIKKDLGVPLVVSLHINPDVDCRGYTLFGPHWKERLAFERMLPFEKATLREADWVLPVYEPIRSYAERRGAKRIQVCYNALNPVHLRKKESYVLNSPVKIISVGRQFAAKNPKNLILALGHLPEAELTLVGDGPYHDLLQREAVKCGVAERVRFHPAIPNNHLCQMLPEFDIFATHSDYYEASKSVLEALLTGLPVVLNHRRGEPVPEFQGDFLLLVENNPEGYSQAIRKLIEDHAFREALGRKAYLQAQAHWAPAKTEAKFVEIYQSLLT